MKPSRVFMVGAGLCLVVAAIYAFQGIGRSVAGWTLTAIACFGLAIHARRRARDDHDAWIIRTPSPFGTSGLFIAAFLSLATTVMLVLFAAEFFEANPERARLIDLRPFFGLGAALTGLLTVNCIAQLAWRRHHRCP